jgi:hypothetical protein
MLKKLSLALLAVLLVGSLVLFSCGDEPTAEGEPELLWSLEDWLTDNIGAWDGSVREPLERSGNWAAGKVTNKGIEITRNAGANTWDGLKIRLKEGGDTVGDNLNLPLNFVNYTVKMKFIADISGVPFVIQTSSASAPYTTFGPGATSEAGKEVEIEAPLAGLSNSNSVQLQTNAPYSGKIIVTSLEVWGPDAEKPAPPLPPVASFGEILLDIAAPSGAWGSTVQGNSYTFALTSAQKTAITASNGENIRFEIKATGTDASTYRVQFGNDAGSGWNALATGYEGAFDGAGNWVGSYLLTNPSVAEYFILQRRSGSGEPTITEIKAFAGYTEVAEFSLANAKYEISNPVSVEGTALAAIVGNGIHLFGRGNNGGLKVAINSAGLDLNVVQRKYTINVTGRFLGTPDTETVSLYTIGDNGTIASSTALDTLNASFNLTGTFGWNGTVHNTLSTSAIRIASSGSTDLYITGITVTWLPVAPEFVPPPDVTRLNPVTNNGTNTVTVGGSWGLFTVLYSEPLAPLYKYVTVKFTAEDIDDGRVKVTGGFGNYNDHSGPIVVTGSDAGVVVNKTGNDAAFIYFDKADAGDPDSFDVVMRLETANLVGNGLGFQDASPGKFTFTEIKFHN